MEIFLPLASYAFVTSITPGPNNIMLTASGVSFGFKRTIPHLLGIPLGFGIQLVLCAIGLGTLLIKVPELNTGLKIIGSAYLLYLAWVLRSNVISDKQQGASERKPMTLFNAASFQFANPKAWIMAITGATVFIPKIESFFLSVLTLTAIFCIINVFCIALWALMGSSIKSLLRHEKIERIFSGIIVLMVIYSAIAVWFGSGL